MRNSIKNLLVGVLLFGNAAIGICLGAFFWLGCVWMIDVSRAADYTTMDWAGLAIKRAALGVTIGLLIGFLFGLINRSAFANIFPGRARPHWLVAGIVGWLAALGAIAGSIQFAIEKPFL